MKTLIEKMRVSAYKIPTDQPESDGTLKWESTTMVLVELEADHQKGTGFIYGHEAVAQVIETSFRPLLEHADVFQGQLLWEHMLQEVRNTGSRGIAANAMAAVDMALWDLKARLFNVPLCRLWGMARDKVPVYGSGGFTSYTRAQMARQFEGWQSQGIYQFKMKVGRHADEDLQRVREARQTIGEAAKLFVDANGAYTRTQALALAEGFRDCGVEWFEEPVSSDDLEGLSWLRNRAPAGMDIAAGEYGYDSDYFRCMLEAGAVNVLQADATRCGGFTGFFQAAHLSRAFHLPLSSHTAPSIHLHACLSLPQVCHMEYFHDHVRIEQLFFEGTPILQEGCLVPDLASPGLGLELKEQDVQPYLIAQKERVYG